MPQAPAGDKELRIRRVCAATARVKAISQQRRHHEHCGTKIIGRPLLLAWLPAAPLLWALQFSVTAMPFNVPAIWQWPSLPTSPSIWLTCCVSRTYLQRDAVRRSGCCGNAGWSYRVKLRPLVRPAGQFVGAGCSCVDRRGTSLSATLSECRRVHWT